MTQPIKVHLTIDVESSSGEALGEVLASIITELIQLCPPEQQAELASRMTLMIEAQLRGEKFPPDESLN
ncbi:hypothetical protein [Leptolyngbya sp. 7M]|uniref:hypothetical protein n=1 Tax=Leptolyngbya sp. 7M TaxID=2812896 RepID=UPI001B8B983F|nr:hypothetical protein [Leptolyngbya sp. 7M]QYO62588.1 hypothetical protein JVX88_21320 [Leptolyngbya sp. 7M]